MSSLSHIGSCFYHRSDIALLRMNKVAVLGCGLLGGSIALAVQKYLPEVHVSLWGRREASIQEALNIGVIHATIDLEEAVREAELIILSTPVGAMLSVLEKVASLVSLDGVIITDVGSVKLTPRETLKEITQRIGAKYIGSHPMAGSEQAGVSAASEDLFEEAACVITNDFQFSKDDTDRLQTFWESLGCRCYVSSSEEHDRVMARISHFPHLLASLGAFVGLKMEEDAQFAGNGMRDTTRVASGHPEMWAEILVRNRKSLKEPIEEAIEFLRSMQGFLENKDEKAILDMLKIAKKQRDQL